MATRQSTRRPRLSANSTKETAPRQTLGTAPPSKRSLAPQAIFDAVESQRNCLLNVMGVVQCIVVAVRHSPPQELEAAVQLVEEQLQGIVEGLEQIVIERKLAQEVAHA